MTGFKISLEDFPNVCRLCLKKQDNLRLMDHILGLLDIFKNIIKINIAPEDSLPRNVCHECSNKLEYISGFIDVCVKSEISLRSILDKHKHNQCPEADSDQSFSPLEQNLEDNLNKSDDTIEEILKCTELPQENPINLPSVIKSKIIRPSTKKQSSDCDVCGEYFNTRTELCEHKKTNINCRTRPYKCSNCEKAFFTKFKLKLHIRSHTKETPFECKICLKKFRFPSNINRHVDVVHKGLKPFKCDLCGKGFSRKTTLSEHKRDHTGELPFICNFCGLSFNKTGSYQYHLNLHKAANSDADLKCSICDKIFGSQSSLRKHKLTHTKENNFLCDMCGKNFRTNQTLANHMNVHLGLKSFECNFCDKTFSRKSTLKVHCLSHTKDKPFKCNTCLRAFAQEVHLKNHERVHNGEKPYQCMFCSRKFSVKCNLVIHTRIHTKDSKYKCTVCGKIYYESRSLKKHMKVHQDSSLIVLTNEDISTLLA